MSFREIFQKIHEENLKHNELIKIKLKEDNENLLNTLSNIQLQMRTISNSMNNLNFENDECYSETAYTENKSYMKSEYNFLDDDTKSLLEKTKELFNIKYNTITTNELKTINSVESEKKRKNNLFFNKNIKKKILKILSEKKYKNLIKKVREKISNKDIKNNIIEVNNTFEILSIKEEEKQIKKNNNDLINSKSNIDKLKKNLVLENSKINLFDYQISQEIKLSFQDELKNKDLMLSNTNNIFYQSSKKEKKIQIPELKIKSINFSILDKETKENNEFKLKKEEKNKKNINIDNEYQNKKALNDILNSTERGSKLSNLNTIVNSFFTINPIEMLKDKKKIEEINNNTIDNTKKKNKKTFDEKYEKNNKEFFELKTEIELLKLEKNNLKTERDELLKNNISKNKMMKMNKKKILKTENISKTIENLQSENFIEEQRKADLIFEKKLMEEDNLFKNINKNRNYNNLSQDSLLKSHDSFGDYVDTIIQQSYKLYTTRKCDTCTRLLSQGKSTSLCPKFHHKLNIKK